MSSRKWACLENRFWDRVERSDGCWSWRGAKTPVGYGYLTKGDGDTTKIKAHRLSWELHFGKIPDGLFVCHKCDNPNCCNPDHLFLGTAADNNNDAKSKGRSRGARGELQPKSKLSEPDVLAIRASKETQDALAARYGVSQAAISLAKRGVNWSWL